ncbi:MAG: hypothetical protein ACKVHL_07415 [Rhodospirillales bacterium]
MTVPLKAQTIHGAVPSPVRELVQDVLQEAKILSATMITRRRSTHQKSAFLFQVLQDSGNTAAIRQRYGTAARRVINLYLANKMKSRAVVLALMNAEIKKQIVLLGENRKEFAFVGTSKVHKFVVMPDIDYAGYLKRFETVLDDHPDFTGWQGSAHAGRTYHVEIPKTLKTISGLWRGRCWITLAGGEEVKYRQVLKLKRNEKGYYGTRKSPSHDGERWITSALENLTIDRRSKRIAYTYWGEKGNRIHIAGTFNEDYNQIKFDKNSSNAKCKTRKRL